MRSRTRAACVTVALLLTSTACSPPVRHAALTFFFDGVPPLAAPLPAHPAAGEPATFTVRHYSEHGPYAARLCTSCHDSAANNSFVAPRDQLCTHCHDFAPKKKLQHDPFESGDCLTCHDPHSSVYRYLLVAQPNEICAGCHEKEALPEDAAHADAAKSCVDCHDPHQSDRESLLR
jgi:predicted CXXCH cytochrome family protein